MVAWAVFSSILAYSRSRFWGGCEDLLFRTGALGLVVEPESVLGGVGGACGGALGGGNEPDWEITFDWRRGTNKLASGFKSGAGLISWECDWIVIAGGIL